MRSFLIPCSVAVAVAVAVAGCSSSSSTSGGATSNATSLAGKKIVYVSGSKVAQGYIAIGCAGAIAAQKAGVGFSVQAPDTFSVPQQIQVLDAVIASKPNAIIISPVDPKALMVPLKQAADEGIKIITAANSLTNASFVTSEVIGDDLANGEQTAEELAKLANGRTGDVAYITYTPGGSAITDARREGFESQIKKYPNLHYLGPTIVSGVNPADGAAAANAILSAHPNLLALVSAFSNVDQGAATAVRERGAKSVIVMQEDSTGAGIDALKSGAVKALLGETYYDEGTDATEQAINALTGKPVTKTLMTQPVLFTPGNVNDPSVQKYVLKNGC